MTGNKTVVFIHGLNMNGAGWEVWENHFVNAGYKCFSPSYPFHEGNPIELQKKMPEELKNITLNNVVDYLEKYIKTLGNDPILIGHSMGGLIVQKLLERGIGTAGVCICSAPPFGIVCFKPKFIKLNFQMTNLLKGNSLFMPSLQWFREAVCNMEPKEVAQYVLENHVVPESRNLPRSIVTSEGKINFEKINQPIFFIAGEKDNITPAVLNKRNADAYKPFNKTVTFKQYKNNSHFICWQNNWQEVANDILQWVKTV